MKECLKSFCEKYPFKNCASLVLDVATENLRELPIKPTSTEVTELWVMSEHQQEDQ